MFCLANFWLWLKVAEVETESKLKEIWQNLRNFFILFRKLDVKIWKRHNGSNGSHSIVETTSCNLLLLPGHTYTKAKMWMLLSCSSISEVPEGKKIKMTLDLKLFPVETTTLCFDKEEFMKVNSNVNRPKSED